MKIRKNPLKVLGPFGDESDVQAIREVILSGWWGKGPKVQEFEEKFAEMIGVKHAIAVTSNSHGQDLVMKAMGFKGVDVINPTMSFIATAEIPLWNECTSNIVDVDRVNLNITAEEIEKWKRPDSEVCIAVNNCGIPAPIDEIRKVFGGFIIEDCAHAIGTIYNGKHVGMFGKAGCFSFYPTKNFTTIEGGMVITNSKRIADFVRTARNHGLTKSLSQRFSRGKPWDYDVKQTGFNYRLDEIRASLGINQLKRVKKLNELRKSVCKYYYENLSDIDGIIAPNISNKNDNVYHLYIIRVNKNYGKSRDNLFRKLLKLGIRTSLHYKPLHEFTVYKKLAKKKSLSNTINLYNEILSLPLHPYLTRKEQDYVIKCIKHK